MEALPEGQAHSAPVAAPAAPVRGARGAPRSERVALRPPRAVRPVVVPDAYDDGDEDDDDDGMETGKVRVCARAARARRGALPRGARSAEGRQTEHTHEFAFWWAAWLLPRRRAGCALATRARVLGRYSALTRRRGAGRAPAAAARPAPARLI
jgi:hypothetical protein